MKILAIWISLVTLAGCDEIMAENEMTVNENDQCGAHAFQYLVGANVDDVEKVEGLPDHLRVILPRMAITKDYRLDRLNIYIGPDNRVSKVECG